MVTVPRALVVLLSASLAWIPHVASADASCPAVVTRAAKQAFPDATVTRCVAEKSGFEVEMQKRDKSKVELDISAQGEIEQIEELVPLAAVPAAVTKAIAARYPKASMVKAEKQTRADKSVTFEVVLKLDKGQKEATFKADGTFVEEE